MHSPIVCEMQEELRVEICMSQNVCLSVCVTQGQCGQV